MAKKLGTFILIIGVIIMIAGVLEYASSQPIKFDPAKSEMTPFGGRNDLGNLLNVQTSNLGREVSRKFAGGLFVVGLVVTIFGAIIVSNSKKNTTSGS